MFNFSDLSVIPTFLNKFKVEKILVIGLSNKLIMDEILSFLTKNNSLLYAIDSKMNINHLIKDNNDLKNNIKYFQDDSLNVLPKLDKFDAVFINGDSNWYTVYNELNLIKKNNLNFPIVFVCNNKYPHKRRDTYTNPDKIPEEFKNEYSDYLPIFYEENDETKYVMIQDGFYHAIEKNTPKNGVLTAIEDFVNENVSLKFLEINPLEGITLIYQSENDVEGKINQIIGEKIENINTIPDFSDKLIENDILLKYVSRVNLTKDSLNRVEHFESKIEYKNNQLKEYEDTIHIQNNQIKYKDSKIDTIKSQIDLEETKLQNLEAKLLNKDNELRTTKDRLISLEDNFVDVKKELIFTKKQLSEVSTCSFDKKVTDLEDDFSEFKDELVEIKKQLQEVKRQVAEENRKLSGVTKQLSDEIKNFHDFKEYLVNRDLEMEYIRSSDKLTKKIISPLSYLYLIVKSKSGEIGTNIKLYKAFKRSNCFDIGYYLNKYPDILNSKWCKYFSPQLHYVCNGFDERRTFTDKNYNYNSKRELLKDIENK